jgi:predicted RNase H-like HicB family nuclease
VFDGEVTLSSRIYSFITISLFLSMVAHTYTFTVILEADNEAGGFAVHVPALPGCHTEGDTREEAIAMAQDAIAGYIESLLEHNESISIESSPAGLTPEQFHELL